MIKELLQVFTEVLAQFYCGLIKGHEQESCGINDKTLCDCGCWCKHCGKPM